MRARALSSLFRAFTLMLLLVGAWAGCRCRSTPPAARPSPPPSLRLVLLSSVAGAMEPCGCVKDMLGGVDHAAAHLGAQGATPTLVLGSGPMLFQDPHSLPDRKTQDLWKAEALGQSFRDMGLRAWAPGANDFAAGAGELERLTRGGPALLAANLESSALGERLQKTAVFSVAGIPIGVAGVALPKHAGKLPDGVLAHEARPALASAAAELRRAQAKLRVALVALPRGEALRLAELVPDFQVLLIGKSVDQGESNDAFTPPAQIGRTLVIESPNHLQAFYTVDLFVENGSFEFENGDSNLEERVALDARIRELRDRISTAESSGAATIDVAARRRDLEALEARRRGMERESKVPAGSHYRAKLVEVRESLGSDRTVAGRLGEYYRRVNDHNAVALKDRRPPEAAAGQSSYVGVEACAKCHEEEFAFWKTTRHAKAYATLTAQHKEFNLDCVSCHVTGYEKPGGSSVVQVRGLTDVQCETCHGPGSLHSAKPEEKKLIQRGPERGMCGPQCHHVPHVKPDWNADAVWSRILGPGHGY